MILRITLFILSLLAIRGAIRGTKARAAERTGRAGAGSRPSAAAQVTVAFQAGKKNSKRGGGAITALMSETHRLNTKTDMRRVSALDRVLCEQCLMNVTPCGWAQCYEPECFTVWPEKKKGGA